MSRQCFLVKISMKTGKRKMG